MFLFSIHKPTHPSIMIDLAVRCQCTERLADTGADARPVRFDVQDTRDSIVKREDVTHAHFSEVGQKWFANREDFLSLHKLTHPSIKDECNLTPP